MLTETIRCEAILPALALLPARMKSPAAIALLLAIGLQETRLIHRRQIGGPARGLWQFEQDGGVRGVLEHPSSKKLAAAVCDVRGVEPTASRVYDALEDDDVLAAAFARLLLWTDPKPLPELGDMQGSWDCYIRTWRPGKPYRHTWAALYATVAEAMPCIA